MCSNCICLVAAHILHDKIRYCQTSFNSYYVTGISVLCYRNIQFLVFFPFLNPPQKCSKGLRRQKRKKLIPYFYCLGNCHSFFVLIVCEGISLPFDSGISYGINGQLVILTVDILYLIFMALKVL
jgi:hypothetical protein